MTADESNFQNKKKHLVRVKSEEPQIVGCECQLNSWPDSFINYSFHTKHVPSWLSSNGFKRTRELGTQLLH